MGRRGPGATRLNLDDVRDDEPCAWSDEKLTRPERVIAFLEDMTITSGPLAGDKLWLRDWQKQIIEEMYADGPDGQRATRTAIISMARKNGKTELAAGLALCHLSGPEAEQRGECYSAGNDKFQASKIFQEMAAMIRFNPWLAKRCNVIRGRKEITDITNLSTYAALTREANTKLGLNASFCIFDELGSTKSRELYDAMDSSMGGRRAPLMIVISTQAADDAALMSQLIDYGLKVRSGEITNPSFHLTFFSAPIEADPWDEATWETANPALGDFRSLEDVRRLAAQAQRMPGRENSFRNLILNQRVTAHTPFIKPEVWKACGGVAAIPAGAKVYAALDLGATRDMSALILIAQDLEGIFHVVPYFWLPGEVAEREDEDRAPYGDWVQRGFLTLIGETTDPKVVAQKIAEVNGQYRIQTLSYDRWRIGDLKRELDAIGCPIKITPHGQGFKDMSPAVDILERLVIQRRIKHSNHPVLAMNANNAVVTRDAAGGRKLDKAKSRGRIDGLVALAMAFSVAMVKPQLDKQIDISTLIA